MDYICKSPRAFSEIEIISRRLGIKMDFIRLSNNIIDDIYGFIKTGTALGDIDTAVDFELLTYVYGDLLEGIMDVNMLDEEAVLALNNICEDLYKFFITVFKTENQVYEVCSASLNYITMRSIYVDIQKNT